MIKLYKNYKFDTETYIKNKYIENGEAKIYIEVSKYEDFIDDLSYKQIVLNDKISSYIEHCAYYIPLKHKINLIIKDNFTDEEKENIRAMIKNHFGLIVGDKIQDIKTNKRKTLILMFLGIVFLSISYLFIKNIYIYDLVSIIGTFSIWEAIDNSFIEKRNIKTSKLNYSQLSLMNVTFEK